MLSDFKSDIATGLSDLKSSLETEISDIRLNNKLGFSDLKLSLSDRNYLEKDVDDAGELHKLQDTLEKENTKIEGIEKALCAIMLLQLEAHCADHYKTNEYSHLPSYIKRTSGASLLFNDKAIFKWRRQFSGYQKK
jgi:hypothetical protein